MKKIVNVVLVVVVVEKNNGIVVVEKNNGNVVAEENNENVVVSVVAVVVMVEGKQ